jgi:hypothetical protein
VEEIGGVDEPSRDRGGVADEADAPPGERPEAARREDLEAGDDPARGTGASAGTRSRT